MKKLISLFLIFSLQVHAAPPAGVGSQSSPTINYSNNTITPYSQATKLAGVNTLIETGNENMIVNPGFEGLGTTGWTCTVGTCTKTITAGEFSSGKAALKVALSAQSMNVSQTITTPSGIQKQGFARVIYRAPATMADFQVCTLVDAAEQTCVPTANLIKDDTFRSIEIPLTFGATSAGIKFKTTSTYTATAYFDGAIVAQGLGLQNLNTQETDAFTYTASAATLANNVAEVEFGSFATYGTTTSNGVMSIVSDTPNTRTKFVCLKTKCNVHVSWQAPVNGLGIRVNIYKNGVAIAYANEYVDTYIMAVSADLQVSLNDYITVGAASSVNTGDSLALSIVATYSASAQVYSQASANTDWAPCTFSTLVWQGLGTVTSNLECQRSGSNLEIKGNVVLGTVAAALAQFPLPTNYGTITTQSSSINDVYGEISRGVATAGSRMIAIATVGLGYFQVSNPIISSANNPTTPVNGNSPFATGDTLSYLNIKIPIAQWSNSTQIVGSFENVPTVPGAGARIDVFSVGYGTTNLTTPCSGTPCLIDQIGSNVSTITRASTGSMTMNLSKTYLKLFCTLSASASAALAVAPQNTQMSCANCNAFPFVTQRPFNETPVDSYGTLNCMGSY